MGRLAKWLATAGGVGYLPGAPGTWGSVLGLVVGLAAWHACAAPVGLILLLASTLIAVAASTTAERLLARHDPSCVVIDEVVGMWWTMALAPAALYGSWTWMLLAFGLFRLFDILKPPPLQRLATAPAGWGIVLDDLGAAVYAAAVMWGLAGAHAGLFGR